MPAWTESNGLRVAAYSLAAAAALLAGWRERQRPMSEIDRWPGFWFMTGGLLVTMAVGRAAGLGELATELARNRARSEGWYDQRRKFQAAVAGAIGVTWLVTVLVALWRFPPRRRRYLPAAIVVFTLMCVTGIRLVSLHQIDSLLHRRHLAGIKVSAFLELVGVALTVLVTFWRPRSA